MRLSTSIALFVPALAVAGTLGRHSDAEDIADGALELKASSASETMSASTVKPSIVIVNHWTVITSTNAASAVAVDETKSDAVPTLAEPVPEQVNPRDAPADQASTTGSCPSSTSPAKEPSQPARTLPLRPAWFSRRPYPSDFSPRPRPVGPLWPARPSRDTLTAQPALPDRPGATSSATSSATIQPDTTTPSPVFTASPILEVTTEWFETTIGGTYSTWLPKTITRTYEEDADFTTTQWVQTFIGGTYSTWVPKTIRIQYHTLSAGGPPVMGEIGMGTLTGKTGRTQTVAMGAAPTQGPGWGLGVAAAVGAGMVGMVV